MLESFAVWLVLLPAAPVLAAEIFYPSEGLLSDSLARSGSALLPVLVALGYALASALEYYVFGRAVGLAVTVPLTLTALSTVGLGLLVDGAACDSFYCIFHSVILFVYVGCELVGFWWRGYRLLTLLPFVATSVGLGIAYRVRIAEDGFDVTQASARNFVNWVETAQVAGFVGARVLVTTAPTYY